MLNLIFDIRWFTQAVEREAEGGDERWEIEDCHLSDMPCRYGPVEGDDLNPEGPIEGKRRLGIGTCRRETPFLLHPSPKDCGGENGANRFSPPKPRRWHTQRRVFFQERYQPGDIVGLPRLHIASKQHARRCIKQTSLRYGMLIRVIVRSQRDPGTVQGTLGG